MTMSILDLFNSFRSAREVREWINENIHKLRIYDEWPRGSGALSILTIPLRQCKFSDELSPDMQALEDSWSNGDMPVL